MEEEKDMEVEGSHILAKQRTKDSEKILDYDYKKCAGCSICVAICPKKALQEGPLKEIAKGLDAPPVLIEPRSLRILWDVRELLSNEGLRNESCGEKG